MNSMFAASKTPNIRICVTERGPADFLAMIEGLPVCWQEGSSINEAVQRLRTAYALLFEGLATAEIVINQAPGV